MRRQPRETCTCTCTGRRSLVAVLALLTTSFLSSRSAAAAPTLVALVPADDVRASLAIADSGAVYAGDGAGGWIRVPGTALGRTAATAARGAAGPVVGGDGAVFRFVDAATGWTAIRLAQKGKPLLATGPRAVAAIGRDVFELDRGAEPTRLTQLDGPILALAAGPTGVLARTARGLVRLAAAPSRPGKPTALAGVPASAILVGDRWAIEAGRRVLDVVAHRSIALAADLAAVTEADADLLAVVTGAAGLELVTVSAARGTVARAPIALGGAAVPVAIVADRRGGVAIALRDGRVAVRARDHWTVAEVRDPPASAHPGSPPATTP